MSKIIGYVLLLQGCNLFVTTTTIISPHHHSKNKILSSSSFPIVKILEAESSHEKLTLANEPFYGQCTKIIFLDGDHQQEDGPYKKEESLSLVNPTIRFNLSWPLVQEEPWFNLTDFHHSTPCTLALYWVSRVKSVESVGVDWLWRFPGGIYGTYHVIVILGNHQNDKNPLSLSSASSPEPTPIQKLMHNLLFVVQKNEDDERNKILDIFFSDGKNIGFYEPTKNKVSIRLVNLVETRWSNFNQKPIILAATPEYSDEIFESYRMDGTFDYPQIPLFTHLCDSLNATIEVVQPEPAVFGKKISGVWVGCVGLLADDLAHVTVPMSIAQYDRTEVLTYSFPLFFDSVIFLTSIPRPLRGSISFLIKPLGFYVWMGILTAILVMQIVLKIVYRVLDRMLVFEGIQRFTTVDALAAILCPILEQEAPLKNSRMSTTSFRLIVGIWLIVLIVLNCAYRSKLISALVNPAFDKPPETFDELTRSLYEIGAVMYHRGLMEDKFKNLNSPMGQVVRDRVQNYELMDSKAFEKNFVCMGYGHLLRPFALWFLVDHNGKHLFKFSTDYLFPTMGSIGYSRKFPHFSGRFDQVSSRMISQGLDIKFFDISMSRFVTRGKVFASIERGGEDHQDKGQGVAQQTFYLVGIACTGLGLSLTLFLGELMTTSRFYNYFHSRHHPQSINSHQIIFVQ